MDGRWMKTSGHWEWQGDEDGSQVLSLSNLAAIKRPKAATGDYWGNWVYDAKALTLSHKRRSYPISLKDMTSSAAVLDWIAQVAQKPWATEEDLGHLVRALDYLLPLQGNYCGGGVDHRVKDVRKILR